VSRKVSTGLFLSVSIPQTSRYSSSRFNLKLLSDTFYVHNEYSGMRQTKNNYGTGANVKLIFAVQNPHWGAFELKAFIYEVFNVFQNENKDSGSDFCTFFTACYSFPPGKQTTIGLTVSPLRHHSHYNSLPDTRKWTNNAKLYFARKI
jgi:hypothetical protein